MVCNIMNAQQKFSVKSKKAIELYHKADMTPNIEHKILFLTNAIKTKKKFVEAYWKLARVYAQNNEIDKAIELLNQINNEDNEYQAQTQCVISDIYYGNGEYEKAIDILDYVDLISEPQFTRIVIDKKNKCEVAIKFKANPVPFKPVNINKINTIYDDYFPSITADGQMISTTVHLPVLNYNNDIIRYQEDLYVSRLLNDSTWTYSQPLPSPMNSNGNEGSQSFSADGRYMFFVRCDCEDNIGGCDIYYSIRRGNQWSIPQNIGEPANSAYWESNPVISPTGDMIYFTSNRPGGTGKRDLWCVEVKINDNGTLETYNARPLGEPINTIEDDFAPFIHSDNNTLYFSSNGHLGLGSHDIYISRRVGNSWSKPINIGYPINTHGDESGFVVNGYGDKAYFASDKIEKNNKGLDIYEIDLPIDKRPKPMLYSPGKIFDSKTGKPLQARIEIFNQSTNKNYFESLSDKQFGDFTALLPSVGTYGLSVQLDGYFFYTKSIETPGDSIIIPLQPIIQGCITRLDNLFFDYDSGVMLESSFAEIERLFKFLNKNSNIEIEIVGHTDNQGSDAYNINLSNRRAQAVMQALINKGISPERMTAKGMGSKTPVESNETEEGRAMNRRVEIVIK